MCQDKYHKANFELKSKLVNYCISTDHYSTLNTHKIKHISKQRCLESLATNMNILCSLVSFSYKRTSTYTGIHENPDPIEKLSNAASHKSQNEIQHL